MGLSHKVRVYREQTDMRPHAGKAQPRRRLLDETELRWQRIRGELSGVLARNGIPAAWCDREDLKICELLAADLRRHIYREYLVEPAITEGMTLAQVIERTIRAQDELWRQAEAESRIFAIVAGQRAFGKAEEG